MSTIADTLISDALANDNAVAAFQIDEKPVRGRVLRMGAALDSALRGHGYPEPVARLLGEAVLVGALVARSLKFEGRLLVQAHGTNDGAVSMIVADCGTNGDVRCYARYDAPSLERILGESPNPDAHTLMGGGTFAMTIDQGPEMDRYQGLSAIEGSSLGDCAEHYFAQSEQIPTQIKLCVGQVQNAGEDMAWRGGGMMIQQIAGDAARGDTKEAWDTAKALFATLSDEEMLDPALDMPTILYRLFHEDGVRMLEAETVQFNCSCSRERLYDTLMSFPKSERDSMFEDGAIKAKCDFCSVDYVFLPADFKEG